MWAQSIFRGSIPWSPPPRCLQITSGSVYRRQAEALRRCPQRPFASAVAEPLVSEPPPAPGSFGGLDLGDDLLSALSQQQLKTPTEIQSSAIPAILEGGDVLLASHTGSGKTLAYLLPLVKHLKDEESNGAVTRPKRPRALILGPTRELTDQILSVAKSLSHFAKFRSTCANGGKQLSTQEKALEMPQDILVATPQRVAQHAEKGNLFYGDVEVVVLDEADTMFDRGFGPEVRAVLKPLRSKAKPARCILVLATLSHAVRKLLDEEFPHLRYIETSTLHKIVPNARHSFLPIVGTDNKLDHLAQIVAADQAKGRRSMVFCNTLDSCRAAEHYLVERDLATVCYHGDVPLEERRTALRRFAGQDSMGGPASPVLVATDLAARGLDISGRVDHVINFDFPLNPIDFLHRTGRTARAGAIGKVTSLVAKRDRTLASRIEKALASGQPVDQLTGNPDGPAKPKPETIARRSAAHTAERHARKGVRGAARGSDPSKPFSKPGPAGSKTGRVGAGAKFGSRGGKSIGGGPGGPSGRGAPSYAGRGKVNRSGSKTRSAPAESTGLQRSPSQGRPGLGRVVGHTSTGRGQTDGGREWQELGRGRSADSRQRTRPFRPFEGRVAGRKQEQRGGDDRTSQKKHFAARFRSFK